MFVSSLPPHVIYDLDAKHRKDASYSSHLWNMTHGRHGRAQYSVVPEFRGLSTNANSCMHNSHVSEGCAKCLRGMSPKWLPRFRVAVAVAVSRVVARYGCKHLSSPVVHPVLHLFNHSSSSYYHQPCPLRDLGPSRPGPRLPLPLRLQVLYQQLRG
jgi:hypothetical protein